MVGESFLHIVGKADVVALRVSDAAEKINVMHNQACLLYSNGDGVPAEARSAAVT